LKSKQNSAISKKQFSDKKLLDDLDVQKSIGNTPMKEDQLKTPKKFSLYESRIQDSILMLESNKKQKVEDEDFQTFKNEVNSTMQDLKKDALDIMTDMFKK
jgi:hypothetical protein